MVEMIIDNVERQTNYVNKQKAKGKGLGLVFADAFLRGMRDIGYKSPAWALAEELDNAWQAGATTVSIRFGFDAANQSQAKPDMVAICDDGNGLIPEMISYAVRWGGTDREDDRKGFGRFGYGLPSSLVSLAKRYTVYSKTRKSSWHAVTVDLEELAEAAGDMDSTEKLLTPLKSEPPAWVLKAEDRIALNTVPSATVIVLENLDRLKKLSGWILAKSLQEKLLQQFGVIYRHMLPERKIVINGVLAQAVDPLFLMEHGRFFDETPVKAEQVETHSFTMAGEGGEGIVTIRASVLPPNFQSVDPKDYGTHRGKTNKRWEIMRDYNGILICRGKRQIDTVSPPWTKFQTYDANVKVEIDFDPALDEFFGITTAKQQIVIDDDMWQKLKSKGKNAGGVVDLITDMRTRFTSLQDELKAQAENRPTEEGQRPSVAAMEAAEIFKTSPAEPTPEQAAEAERNIEHAADERSRATGEPFEEAKEKVQQEASKSKWQVEFAAIEEGPFYRPKRLGDQKRLVINTEHPFYTKLYVAAGADVKAALEVLLFVLAERELDSRGEAETFYKSERQKWSERLRHALNSLLTDETLENTKNAVAEFMAATVGD